MSPTHCDLVSLQASLNFDILGVKFESNLTFEDHVHGIVSVVSQRIGILRLMKHIFENTSVLFRSNFAFFLPILEYCSPVWGQLLNVIFSFLSARCIQFSGVVSISFLSLCHRCRVAALSILYKVNSNSDHCLFS